MNDFIFDFDSSIPTFEIVVLHVTTEGGGGGQTIEVDSELSTTSNNPVKNKAITQALNGKVSASQLAPVATSGSYNDLTNKPTIPSSFPVDVELDDTSTNPVQNKVITEALGEKMAYPAGGTSGQVLQKTAEGAQWASIGTPSQDQIYQAVTAYIATHPESLNPLSPAVKSALLDCFANVGWKDTDGGDYYDALDAALNAKALLSITAVYTQSGTVYDTDSLDSLKDDLVVTAYYDDGTSADVTSASVLSGTLTEGTSTITVTYQEKTATFEADVSVKTAPYNLNYKFSDITLSDGYIGDDGNVIAASENYYLDDMVPAIGFWLVSSTGTIYTGVSGVYMRVAEYNSAGAFIKRDAQAQANPAVSTDSNAAQIKMGFNNSIKVFNGSDRFVACNYLDTSICTVANTTINTDGSVGSNTVSNTSDFLPIEDGYMICKLTSNSDSAVVAYYDESKNFIERNAVTNALSNMTLIKAIPSNAKYVKFRCPINPVGSIYVSYKK